MWEDGHTFELSHLTTDRQMTFGTTSLFHRQVASALGIPAKYYDLMQSQKPELLAENVNAWLADRTSSYMVRSMDYGSGQVARALLSERYRRIDNMEIATSVLPLFAGNDQYEVMSCEVTENRLYLKVVNHRLEMEVRKGDIVQAGVMISNSEVGLGAVSIQPLVYRLVCLNGMVGQLTIIGSHIFAREGTIELVHLLDHLLRQSLLGPSGKLMGGNQGRMSRLEELGIGSLGIGSEDGTLSLDHLCQFLRIGWQLAYIVPFILQANQEIVERRNHFHSRSGKCILTRTLEVEDGDTLAAVLLVLQIHIAQHALHETLHSVRDAVNLLQALLVDALSENHVWTDGTINLRSHDALRHEAAVHSLLVALPLGGQTVDIKR